MITQYCEHGSLKELLLQCQGHDFLSHRSLVRMSANIAAGMEYLSRIGLVHCDLATRNVFIDSTYHCKIGDFGMSAFVGEGGTYTPPSGTKFPVRWTAPEVMKEGVFTTQSDVWSYGVCMYEIFTEGGQPYSGLTNEVLTKRIGAGLRLSRPAICQEELYLKVMKPCWDANPAKRPTFDLLHEYYTRLQADIDTPCSTAQSASATPADQSAADGCSSPKVQKLGSVVRRLSHREAKSPKAVEAPLGPRRPTWAMQVRPRLSRTSSMEALRNSSRESSPHASSRGSAASALSLSPPTAPPASYVGLMLQNGSVAEASAVFEPSSCVQDPMNGPPMRRSRSNIASGSAPALLTGHKGGQCLEAGHRGGEDKPRHIIRVDVASARASFGDEGSIPQTSSLLPTPTSHVSPPPSQSLTRRQQRATVLSCIEAGDTPSPSRDTPTEDMQSLTWSSDVFETVDKALSICGEEETEAASPGLPDASPRFAGVFFGPEFEGLLATTEVDDMPPAERQDGGGGTPDEPLDSLVSGTPGSRLAARGIGEVSPRAQLSPLQASTPVEASGQTSDHHQPTKETSGPLVQPASPDRQERRRARLEALRSSPLLSAAAMHGSAPGSRASSQPTTPTSRSQTPQQAVSRAGAPSNPGSRLQSRHASGSDTPPPGGSSPTMDRSRTTPTSGRRSSNPAGMARQLVAAASRRSSIVASIVGVQYEELASEP